MNLVGHLLHTAISVTAAGLLLLIDCQCCCTAMKALLILGFISLMGAKGLEDFPQSYVVAKRDSSHAVTLPCGTTTKNDVTWTFEGQDVEFNGRISMDGPNLLVKYVGKPMLGKYTCLSEGQTASTFLLMEAEEEEELDSLLSCRARSYYCTFNCIWHQRKYRAVRLGLGPNCHDGGNQCSWFNGTTKSQNERIHFDLTHSLNPFAEEISRLELTVEAIKDYTFLQRTKTFYLRDIIQPDSPQIVRCQKGSSGINVTIQPPSSWPKPHSFFRLEHQIEYERKDDGELHSLLVSSSTILIPLKITKLRVRSRDPLVRSAWSEWTDSTCSTKLTH
ncbi:interleukin-12 subunit beta [Nerophis ophidion]|uniref:interleukin-12 subunit beta n=1 Tax=Nerophis ophidion TaxID=159077 RepID=UPI002ADF9147|nr:interleukin-12 subunit beta [Nerophis ophidion]